ncbi:MAG: hypothetical protein ACP5H8_01925 [Candidatus Micrarchaeia archaeon]
MSSGGIFSRLPLVGEVLGGRRKNKVSVYASLQDGSIRDKIFYGDVEVFRTRKDEFAGQVRRRVEALIGRGDMQVFLSSEYADICTFMSKNPDATIKILRDISEETAERKEIVRKILRKLSHSQNEVIRTYAFREL